MAVYDEHGRPVILVARLNPPRWKAPGNAVNLLIPEMELQLIDVSGEQPVCEKITEPEGKDPVWWLARACVNAVRGNATLSFCCDTIEELEWAVPRALVMLAPEGYRQVPVEERPAGATLN